MWRLFDKIMDMGHVCGTECRCRLDDAVAALERAAFVMRNSLATDSEEIIASAYAGIRAARVRLEGAMSDYRDHFADAA